MPTVEAKTTKYDRVYVGRLWPEMKNRHCRIINTWRGVGPHNVRIEFEGGEQAICPIRCLRKASKAAPEQHLDDLLAVMDPASEWYLAYELTDRQIEFIADLAEIRRQPGRLALSERQRDWLAAIHADVSRQLGAAEAAKKKKP